MELITKAQAFLNSGDKSPPMAERYAIGKNLAAELRQAAIGLSSNKATEFSPNIPTLHLLAAEVALISFGPNSEQSQIYERDIYYYRSFNPPHSIVAEYQVFKASACLRLSRYLEALVLTNTIREPHK